jgi:hypothetical protein
LSLTPGPLSLTLRSKTPDLMPQQREVSARDA